MNRSGTYYLDNSGTRWINYTNGKKDKCLLAISPSEFMERTVLFYESFGNFATLCISYRGKKIKLFADDIFKLSEYGNNYPESWEGLPIVKLTEKYL